MHTEDSESNALVLKNLKGVQNDAGFEYYPKTT